MAENVAKVVYGGDTLIDLTGDTVTPEKVLKDEIFHDSTGRAQTGTFEGGGAVEPSKEVTPGKDDISVKPAEGYDSMSEVVVKGIPYQEEIDEETGATTVIIG